jgi:hypothetical protein
MQPSMIVWDLETVPDLTGFAVANDIVGSSPPHLLLSGIAVFSC